MKRRIILAITVLSLMLCTCGCNANSARKVNHTTNGVIITHTLTTAQKVSDFEYMYKILKENFPYFGVDKREHHIDWLSMKSTFIKSIKSTRDDISYIYKLESILEKLNNGHVNMLGPYDYYYYCDIFNRDKQYNSAWIKQMNNPKAVQRYALLTKGFHNYKSKVNSNMVFKRNVSHTILDNGKVAYLAIRSFNSYNTEPDMKIIRPFLKKIKTSKALIIDIRGNGGGDDAYWSDNLVPMLINQPFTSISYAAYRGGAFCDQFIKCRGLTQLPISGIKTLPLLPREVTTDFKYYIDFTSTISPQNSIGYKGKIYLLVDKAVFSSSEMFAVFCKGSKFATIVGGRTGGDGIGFDPAVCVLPNSGYVFRFPQEMGLTSDGTCNFEYGTTPDIAVNAKVNSDLSKDSAVQAVLNRVK